MKSNRYWALLDACNDAATLDRFELAYAQLEGYRQALDDFGYGWSPLADDCYTKTKYGDKPMTCGILHHNFEVGSVQIYPVKALEPWIKDATK